MRNTIRETLLSWHGRLARALAASAAQAAGAWARRPCHGQGRSLPLALLILLTALPARAADNAPSVSMKDGSLHYTADEHGNRVPDFSYCGYFAGEKAIPDVPIRIIVSAVEDDNTQRIQSALDYVASLPADDSGIRGAVLLEKGTFAIAGQLRISASGVVLRGSGMGEDGTTLLATGEDRRTLIRIAGMDDRKVATTQPITSEYVPVNATTLELGASHKLVQGDSILITRTCSAEWIGLLGADDFGGDRHGPSWKPGSRELVWDREITSIEADRITFDAPLTNAIQLDLGGGHVAKCDWPGRIRQVGVENLRCVSSFDSTNPKDENHSWIAISIESAQDCWLRQVVVQHFAGGAVSILNTAKRITVEDCKSLDPISEIGGFRRNTFFTAGQQTLFQRCYSENGRHDFAVGFCAVGPNAFVQCEAKNAHGFSGPIDSWAAGVLYDSVRIDGEALRFTDLGYRQQGAGWNAANSMMWNCHAALIEAFSPPTATNWAIGCWGEFNGDGEFTASNDSPEPVSLYYAQLAQRIGKEALNRAHLLKVTTSESSSPTVEEAAEIVRASTQPAPQLADWIDRAAQRNSIPTDAPDAKRVEDIDLAAYERTDQPPAKQMSIYNGWLVADGRLLVGGRVDIAWWSGGIRPADLPKAKPCITRFVPGRVGAGLTDDLDEITDSMLSQQKIALEQHYALWYDRRRDDHERIRRMDGDVRAPFYEFPFARSGQGTAWDGLSKFDLTKYNPWYFFRIQQFAQLCDQKGLLLIHQHFFQHHILEAGAHWADSPWRDANNINNTAFPEPPPYAGDKRIFMAEQFYDVTDAHRASLYRAYIRKCLDITADQSNVIHLTSEEFTGPLHFAQFWVDVIAEWKRETGKRPLIGLSATKDVQDAILEDPQRSPQIDVIDIRYWHYQSDGTAYAPPGGKNLAPRQHARQLKPKPSSFEQVYRAVREYRDKYPGKVIVNSVQGPESFGWAALLGGASLPNITTELDPQLLAAIPGMKPLDLPDARGGAFALGVPDEQYLVYSPDSARITLDGYTARDMGPGLRWLTLDQPRP